jgi:3-methyladenine DNA glycosylase AlkC
MTDLLKNMYSPGFFEKLCPVLESHIPKFNSMEFIIRVYNNQWPDLELKGRIRHITHSLHPFFPADFKDASPLIAKLSRALNVSSHSTGSFPYIFLPDYVEVYGTAHPELSLDCLGEVTKLVSAEFAVRPFLTRYPEMTFQKLFEWSSHPDANVRRLASEGCRPRLPWASSIPELKKNPARILEILENLKNDPSEFVRKSVANNLNDIGKDHPQLLMEVCRKWTTKDPYTRWILRHACRTLLKKGNREALVFHGFNPEGKGKVNSLELREKKIRVGDKLAFDFEFNSLENKLAAYRLEYAIAYPTSTGKTSVRIFKIAEKKLKRGIPLKIHRQQSFRDMTTRKHHKGKHLLTILANGKKMAAAEFQVC